MAISDTSLLETQLTQLINGLTSFMELLKRESEVLKQPDITPLNELSQKKSALSETVENSYVATAQNFSIPQEKANLSLAEILELPIFETFPNNIQKKLTQALELSQQCHEANLANGITIQSLNNVNSTLINIISGTPENATTYGSEGKKKSGQSASKTTLGTA